MATGVDIVRRTLERLRRPSDTALPYKFALKAVSEQIAMKKLDLALSEQNSLASVSDWFTPSSADFELGDLGVEALLPVRMERRSIGDETETGHEVPIVNLEVLNTSSVRAVSFYGSPLRIIFRDPLETIAEQEYRIYYEGDFASIALGDSTGLPSYFDAMISLESALDLLLVIEDDSADWVNFKNEARQQWMMQIADYRAQWREYVRKFKGKAQVPKLLFSPRCGTTRTKWFKG